MTKINEIELNLLRERLVNEEKSAFRKAEAEQAKLDKEKTGRRSPDLLDEVMREKLRDEAIRQRLGIEGRVIRVFKRKAQAPVREAKTKGWLFREVMKRG